VTADGTRLGAGSRQQLNPSSSAYREHALRLVERMAERYGHHPALIAWHIGNEYGCHVPASYDDETAARFRDWLRDRYGSVAELNRAWTTAFWGQEYGSFEEVDVPRAMPTFPNPTQSLDFDRFSSDALLGLYLAERAVLKRISPLVPVTTNFMGFFKAADYWSWAPYLDFVSDDVYPDPADEDAYVGLAAQRDLMRSLGGGRPWVVMEAATTAVQWREVNVPKPRGLHRAQSLQAVARGADGILHFQWRQSIGGAERFHAAMLPHAGSGTRVFSDVCALGSELADLAPDMVGQPVPADVAMIIDWDSFRAVEQPAMPAAQSYLDRVLTWYAAFLRAGVTVDFRPPDADDLGRYRLVVAPLLHVLTSAAAERLADAVAAGAHLAVGCFSGVVDQDLRVWQGGYLGPLAPTLGVRVVEHAATRRGDVLGLTGILSGTATTWQDLVEPDDAEVVASFDDGYAAGLPAVTRRAVPGGGSAWYVGTVPSPATLDALVERWVAQSGATRLLRSSAPGVEAVVRGDHLVLVNHHGARRSIVLADGRDVELAPYEVIRTARWS
jgi:beta-galactosidase